MGNPTNALNSRGRSERLPMRSQQIKFSRVAEYSVASQRQSSNEKNEQFFIKWPGSRAGVRRFRYLRNFLKLTEIDWDEQVLKKSQLRQVGSRLPIQVLGIPAPTNFRRVLDNIRRTGSSKCVRVDGGFLFECAAIEVL
jgi:hypothetical protein